MATSKKKYPTAFKLNGKLIRTEEPYWTKEKILNWIGHIESRLALTELQEEKDQILIRFTKQLRGTSCMREALKAKGYFLDTNELKEMVHDRRSY